MSKFFVIDETAVGTVVIDDTNISTDKVWSSKKTKNEIEKSKITRFEELEDVDVSNKQDRQVVAYSKDTGKFITIDGVEAGEITGLGLNQVSKMGIEGSEEKPTIVSIPINTVEFKVPKVNVLKYKADNKSDLLITKNTFSNTESRNFEEDEMIIFDGKAHLKTEHEYVMTNEGKLEEGTLYSAEIIKSKFKEVSSVESEQDGVLEKIKLNAIPKDRLLIPVGDLNLSNVEHIDFFRLNAAGKNLRIVCSIDSGSTWKTFKEGKWQDVNLTVEDIKANGIDISTFNNINNTFWNELLTTNKIRFAYLFSMDDIKDIEEIDQLDMQYDGQGSWIQAKDNEFDVVYGSNTLLQVYVKFSGDIKINY